MTTALLVIALYLAVGVLFALVYVTRLAPSRDPVLASSPRRVRLLLLPGAVAVWPFLLTKRSPMNANLRRRHLLVWLFIAPLLIVSLALALLLRSAP